MAWGPLCRVIDPYGAEPGRLVLDRYVDRVHETTSALVIRAHGDADRLELEQVRTPAPGRGQLLVEVEASGVAYADVLMRRGIYPESPRLPFTPGYDLVGRVVGVSEDVTRLGVGDRVAALTVTGANAMHTTS